MSDVSHSWRGDHFFPQIVKIGTGNRGAIRPLRTLFDGITQALGGARRSVYFHCRVQHISIEEVAIEGRGEHEVRYRIDQLRAISNEVRVKAKMEISNNHRKRREISAYFYFHDGRHNSLRSY